MRRRNGVERLLASVDVGPLKKEFATAFHPVKVMNNINNFLDGPSSDWTKFLVLESSQGFNAESFPHDKLLGPGSFLLPRGMEWRDKCSVGMLSFPHEARTRAPVSLCSNGRRRWEARE